MPDIDDILEEEAEPIEAYCVRCKETVEVEEPQAVWTRKGSPGTRGTCSICGTTVFRMGKTDAHRDLKQPKPVKVAEGATASGQKTVRSAITATYVAYADADAVFTHKLANDLNNMGVPTYVPGATNGEVAWASGVHPALEDCTQLLVVLSANSLDSEKAQKAWTYFRSERKRVVVAQLTAVDVPDDIRRAPRVDFSSEYKPALRELVLALAE